MQQNGENGNWLVYIIRCKDESLYTGITNDLYARIEKHNNGTGAKYTRGRGPVEVLITWEFDSRSSASKEEYRIKKMTKTQKMNLIDSNQ